MISKLRPRIIPTLLLKDNSLVKTVQFKKYSYIGDPVNTCRIFNELEVDELCFLDIFCTLEKREPNYELLAEIASECFMPLSYGGGIDSLSKAEKIFKIGFEKVVINTSMFTNPSLIEEITQVYGNQSLIASVDVKKNLFGRYEVFSLHGTKNEKRDPADFVKELEDRGAGEILLNNIDREGTWRGFDVELIKRITGETNLPLVASGGAGSVADISLAISRGGCSAVALGSMVVYQQRGMGVLVNFPDIGKLNSIYSYK